MKGPSSLNSGKGGGNNYAHQGTGVIGVNLYVQKTHDLHREAIGRGQALVHPHLCMVQHLHGRSRGYPNILDETGVSLPGLELTLHCSLQLGSRSGLTQGDKAGMREEMEVGHRFFGDFFITFLDLPTPKFNMIKGCVTL